MKRRVFLALLFILGALTVLSGCVLTEESGYGSTMKALEEADNVTVHLYGEEEEAAYRVPVTEELTSLLKGNWVRASGQDGGTKLLTITVSTQHEITFFDNGRAMIYYGYASVVERDRCYYTAELENELSAIEKYTDKNGIHADAAAILELFARDGDEKAGKKPYEIKATLADKADETYSFDSSSALNDLFAGSWKKAEKAKGDEALTMMVDGKYKLCLFTDQIVAISEINSLGEEKNTAYYSVNLDGGEADWYNYIIENGKVLK